MRAHRRRPAPGPDVVRGAAAVAGPLLVSLTGALLTGCAGGAGTQPAPGAEPSGSRTGTAPATAAARPGTSGEPGGTPDACADADCEVRLVAGDGIRFTGPAGAARFEIGAVDDGAVTWSLPGARRCGTSGPGSIRVTSDGAGCRGTVGPGTTLRAEGVTVTFLDVGADTVLVRLRPRL
ncbi:hypothetical protein [Streptomyces hebeiensis]